MDEKQFQTAVTQASREIRRLETKLVSLQGDNLALRFSIAQAELSLSRLRHFSKLQKETDLVLTIQQLVDANRSRVARWHPLESWSPLEWAGAMAGEAGEACNAAKKLKRISDGIQNINAGERSLTDEAAARRAVALEVADTIIYGVLLCLRVDADLETALCDAFNRKSEEYGFPERIGSSRAPMQFDPPPFVSEAGEK